MTQMKPSYGLWVILGPNNNDMWMCRCSGCGLEKFVSGRNLRSGASEGCAPCRKKGNRNGAVPKSDLRRQFAHVDQEVFYRVKRAVKHAINRCTDPNDEHWKDYGGRGISVVFSDRSMFVGHLLSLPGHDDPNLVLDRINNDGNYEAGNLRFVTCTESTRNRRKLKSKRFITFNGRTQDTFQWSNETGIPYKTILVRLDRGWTEERTLTTPVEKR